MLRDFYGEFGSVSLTLLGLWFVVVEIRHGEWAASRHHRRRATAVWLIFALPGMLSLLSLIADTPALWRVSFAVGGAVGAAVLFAVVLGPSSGQSPVIDVGLWAAGIMFAAIALVAMLPEDVADAVGVRPLEVEAVLLSVLLVVGLTVAWLLVFAELEPKPAPAPAPGHAEQPSPAEPGSS